jgi:hypothetical protein
MLVEIPIKKSRPISQNLDQRVPVLGATMMFNGVEDELDIPAPVGAAVAVSETTPRFEGFQEQVATIFGELPVVDLFLQPGKLLPLTLNVTFDATVIFAVITTAVR